MNGILHFVKFQLFSEWEINVCSEYAQSSLCKLLKTTLGIRGPSHYTLYCHALGQIPSLCLLPWTLHERAGTLFVCLSQPGSFVCQVGSQRAQACSNLCTTLAKGAVGYSALQATGAETHSPVLLVCDKRMTYKIYVTYKTYVTSICEAKRNKTDL